MGGPCQPNVNVSFTFARARRRKSPFARGRSASLAVMLLAAVGLAACGSTPPTASSGHSDVAGTPTPSSVPSPATSSSPSASSFTGPPPSTLVTAFYYLWYGTLANDGAWRHWNQLSH